MVVKDIIEELRHYPPNAKVFLRNCDYLNAKDVPAEAIVCKEDSQGGCVANNPKRYALVIAGSTRETSYPRENTKKREGDELHSSSKIGGLR